MALTWPKPPPAKPVKEPAVILVTGVGRFPNPVKQIGKGLTPEPERK